jgi:hypothetical protein
LPFFLLAIVAVAAVFVPSLAPSLEDGKYNPADVTWLWTTRWIYFPVMASGGWSGCC